MKTVGDAGLLDKIAYEVQVHCDEGLVRGRLSAKDVIVRTLAQLPESDRNKLFERDIRYFAPTASEAFQLLFPALEIDRTLEIIVIEPKVLRMRLDKAMTIVAHELAHVLLGHTRPDFDYQIDAERAADDLIESWGFSRAYRSACGTGEHQYST